MGDTMVRINLLLFLIGSLAINTALCYCPCDYFQDIYWGPVARNISLGGSANFDLHAYEIDIYDCNEVEIYWKVERVDGGTEVYVVVNDTYRRGRSEEIPDSGLRFSGYCFIYFCGTTIRISPTDLRYDGAQITGVLNLPECFNSSNTTDPMTLNIQGLLQAPTNVSIDQVSLESMNVSWSPPFTLDGVPILQYTVYITSIGRNMTLNITETEITLERPCSSTNYKISAWNEVGEGNVTSYDFLLYQAIVKTVTDTSVPGICASCTIFIDSTSDGCAIKLQNDEFTFVFNMFRQSSDELVVLECFSVTEVGEFSVSAYEVQLGEVQEYTSIELPSVTIAKTEKSTLSHAVVTTVNDLSGPGICASCSFTNDSTAEGCSIELQNDKHKFTFNMSRQSSEELALLECFSVPEVGVFSVYVYEIQINGTVGHKVWRLPDVTTSGDRAEESVGTTHDTAVTGLAVVLSLTVVGVVVTVLIAATFIVRRKIVTRTKDITISVPSCDSTKRVTPKSSSCTSPMYENTEMPLSAATTGEDNMYEHMELRPTNAQESAAQYEEIELCTNAAYGRVQR